MNQFENEVQKAEEFAERKRRKEQEEETKKQEEQAKIAAKASKSRARYAAAMRDVFDRVAPTFREAGYSISLSGDNIYIDGGTPDDKHDTRTAERKRRNDPNAHRFGSLETYNEPLWDVRTRPDGDGHFDMKVEFWGSIRRDHSEHFDRLNPAQYSGGSTYYSYLETVFAAYLAATRPYREALKRRQQERYELLVARNRRLTKIILVPVGLLFGLWLIDIIF